jgi:hypothetical protein
MDVHAILAPALSSLNNSKLLTGFAVLLVNTGGRFLTADAGRAIDAVLSHRWMRKLVVFAMFFVATHDVMMALGLTAAYVVLVQVLLHESHPCCIIRTSNKQQHGSSSSDG